MSELALPRTQVLASTTDHAVAKAASCLYVGTVQHHRREPRTHRFRYSLFMMMLDLAELPTVFDGCVGWSAKRPALAWFRRADYYGDPAHPLDECIRNLIQMRTGERPVGPIRLLTHLRYFGVSFNPVSFYYVYDASGAQLQYIVAEITNTPWRERHAYVLKADDALLGPRRVRQWTFAKAFHVSPFMPMDVEYAWRFSAPAQSLYVHMENRRAGTLQFSATLALKRQPLDSRHLARALMRFPVMSAQVITGIYWQAARLWMKRTPFYSHPKRFE